ncbi:phasin family protein [Hyalangium rubrum]|uniref:Phasin family protein n=1 Tax=Hyalangium rubrum TaxID=3103134 RepID=A0ABU5HBN9_9BACT|nr:phasin family protein [Hyalangium sp. s54d21]MDY7230888.1 phasin family protein [Hyalangium sp. s54d21]
MDKPEAPREKHPVAETFERVWSQALGAVTTAEEEVQRTLQRVASAAGWSQEEVKRQAREFTERLVGHRKELERGVEEAVRGAVARLKVPKREELQDFEARLGRLAERIEALGQKK